MSILPKNLDISLNLQICAYKKIEDQFYTYAYRTKRIISTRDQIEGGNEVQEQYRLTLENLCSTSPHDSMTSINNLSPEVFQLIIAKFLESNDWFKIVALRRVNKFWLTNIDNFLSTVQSFEYKFNLLKGLTTPPIDYCHLFKTLSYFPNLTQLVVSNYRVSDHLIAILRNKVPDLRKLDLSGCQGLTWKGIAILGIRFNRLQFLDVSRCELNEHQFGILFQKLNNLRVFNALKPWGEVTFECLSRLGPNIYEIWIGLEHLKDCNSALKALVRGNGKYLLHLGLIVNDFGQVDWSVITENIKDLRTLKLTFKSSSWSNLKEFAKLKNLEFLVLSEVSTNDNESVLTDSSLIQVLVGCSKLRSLAISGNKETTVRITDYSIERIARLCPNMSHMRFMGANSIDDRCLSLLASLPSLCVLHLVSMNSITNEGVKDFAKRARHVRNFLVMDCPNLTEVIIDYWIESAKERPEQKISVLTWNMKISKDLSDLPNNLTLMIYPK